MRPSLIQCFPHPFTRQWPNTGNPVTCECRQLYSLVSVCCCVPNTHLLVLHEAAHVSTNMITSMPKGPKYVDYRITARTTAEDFCGFLMRAEAAASGPAHGGGGAADDFSAFLREAEEVYSPMSSSPTHQASGDRADGKTGASYNAPRNGESITSPMVRGRGPPTQRQVVVVVCLHGIAEASAAVQSALMDVLCFEQVRSHRRAMRVPTLRVVAFCSCRNFALLLPETLRAAFTLSTYVSTLSIESAVVLQTNNVASSNIVNKRFMLEVMSSPDGQALLETVTLSGAVLRYLRHLLLVVRGSFCATISPGALALRRLPRWMTVLRAMAVLFMPDENLLRSRALHIRPAHLHSYTTRASTFVASERAAHSASHRATSTTITHRAGSSTAAAASPNAGSPNTTSASRRHVATTEEPEEAADATGPAKIESFSNVVVSPSDVACVLSSLLGHLMTIPREMVPSEEIMSATNAMMAPAGGSSSVVDAYVNMMDSQRRGRGGFSFQDPTMWDAVAASWSLRYLRGVRDPTQDTADMLGGSFVSSAMLQMSMTNHLGSTLNEAMLTDRGADLRTSLHHRAGSPGQESLMPGGSPVAREAPLRLLNNRPLISVADVWKNSAADTFGVLDTASTPMLDYWEVREVMRATLICRSAPAPG